ncbi:MAG: hypothetical protein L3J39_14700 [Verrucomicrobiales bacterium]|nr:hypothetical protein [Verrucomicrobiales bacterium]
MEDMPCRITLASEDIRLAIIDALRAPERRRFRREDSTSRNYLELWGLPAETIYDDLAEQLEQYELQTLPKEKPSDRQKYQTLLRFPEEDGYCEALIHVKLDPRGEPPIVLVSVHSHNTGHKPLKLIPIKKKTDHEK